ncbi:glycoside hydrolase family 2 protein [Pedobacter glucosidilyticus]|uniref:glycoside hydrolase family 2 protein n=1 Tax=Pedobacter glucosidilyticus TaxID=1122941 RepID=UPI0026F26377|nr:sugar-binding domain-containing protein [Pedobacter glucosidilyticus]
MLKKIFVFIPLFLGVMISKSQVIEDVSFNGKWQFIIDKNTEADQQNYALKFPQTSKEVMVPHTWNIEDEHQNYYGKAWYKKDFEAPKEWKNSVVMLHFGAVYHDAVVYLNGKKIGEHLQSGYTPFAFDLAKHLNYGTTNRLVVSVDNRFSENMLPFAKSFDWAADGGITRSVKLHISAKPSIKYVHITPQLNLRDSSASAFININLNEHEINKLAIKAICVERKTGKVMFSEEKELNKTGKGFSWRVNFNKVTPWHFDNPALYDLKVTTLRNGKSSDVKEVHFGFREIDIKQGKWYLNGEQVRLPGIEYMPGSHPAYGIAEPLNFIDSVARKLKDLNVVITRFHWQQDEAFLNKMDELGILVQEELPWWQKPQKLSPQLLQLAKSQLNEMINAHYNHPSIFAWGLNNEVASTLEDNSALKTYAQQLDTSRLFTVISDKLDKRLATDPSLHGDLPTWNEYVGTWNGKDRTDLPNRFDKINPIVKDKGLLITEYGLCEPAFAGGDLRRVDEMLYHTKLYRENPNILGFIYFCLSDYRTQMGEEGLGKYKIRRHGLTDMFLKPKPSYHVFKQLCSPVDIIKVAKKDEHHAEIEIEAKQSIPSYTLRNYRLKYLDMNGEIKEILIKELKPGEKMTVVLAHINSQYAFEILRPDGFLVIKY